MKNLTITVTFANPTEDQALEEVKTVRSEAAMWNYLREVRDRLTNENVEGGTRAVVKEDDGTKVILFKDITFRRNSKGKIEMPNAVKATCRRQIEKAKAEAKKIEAKKARKREADRRYRARKKAQMNADFEALKERAAAEGRIGEFGEIELTAADLKQQN